MSVEREAARGRGARLAVLAAVALLALLPRLEPALRGWHRSHDGEEYLLLARSLARGEGFLLPVKVRWHVPGPALHPAWDERAPLWPALLAPWVRALGQEGPGWPDPRLQLPAVSLCALAAAQAALLAAALARAQGLGPRAELAAGLGAGLVLAWAPGLVEASLSTWAEPLGVCLALLVAQLLLRFTELPAPRLALALGLVAGCARFARPEQAALAPALLLLVGLSPRLRPGLGRLCLGLLLPNLAGLLVSGVLGPQAFLLTVVDYTRVMRPDPDLTPPGAGEVLRGVAGNAWGLTKQLWTPRYAWLCAPLALLALGRPAARPALLLAGALLLVPTLVWSTSHPSRFSLAPLALLAPIAACEAERRRRQLLGRRTWPRALLLLGSALLLGHHAGGWLGKPIQPPPARGREVGPEPALEDPWGHALLTGEPARWVGPPGR